MILNFIVNGQELTRVDSNKIVSDTVNYLDARFRFSGAWTGLTKSAIFTLNGTDYETILADDRIAASENINLSDGDWSVKVVGYTVDGATITKQITTTSVEFTVLDSGLTEAQPFPNGAVLLPEHNDFDGKQGGTAGEYYHTTQAQNAALHAHSNKTALDAVSGTNTGDQDVSGAISTHNTDAGAHAEMFSAVNGKLESIKPIAYGELVMPSDFVPTLPCKFYRDNDGLIKHNMAFTKYKGGTRIYISPTGNDSSGNGSQLTPYRTLTKAMAIAKAGADAKYEIHTSVPVFNRDECSFDDSYSNKTIAIISDIVNGKSMLTTNATYLWTLDGTGTYKATRSGTKNVIDLINVDVFGVYIPLKQVPTLSACQSGKGTWYTDDVTVWVHRQDEDPPTASTTVVNIAVTVFKPVLGNNAVFYAENIVFTSASETVDVLNVSAGSYLNTEACVYNCIFIGSRKLVNGKNGFATSNVKNTYVFNCISSYSQLDGYNYHFANVSSANKRNCLVVEYGCKGYDCGLVNSGANSNQVSSAHEGASVLRVGTIGNDTSGGLIVDVNGCYSVLYDCHVRHSMLYGGGVEGEGFVFSSDDGGATGKTYLFNCSSKDSAKSLKVYHPTYANNFRYDGSLLELALGSQQGVIEFI